MLAVTVVNVGFCRAVDTGSNNKDKMDRISKKMDEIEKPLKKNVFHIFITEILAF